MKKITFGLVACFFLALPAVCLGATGWYGSVNAGAALPMDSDITVSGISGSAEVEYDGGYTIVGAIGYSMINVRLEGEVSYQANDIDSIDGVSLSSLGASGEVNSFTFMANWYYDLTTGNSFTPYITAGIGATNYDFEVSAGSYAASQDDTVFAYQLGVGAGFALSDTVILDCRYRYLGGSNPEFTSSGYTFEAEVGSNNFTVGLRMIF